MKLLPDHLFLFLGPPSVAGFGPKMAKHGKLVKVAKFQGYRKNWPGRFSYFSFSYFDKHQVDMVILAIHGMPL